MSTQTKDGGLYALESTTIVKFTNVQLVEIAMQTLSEGGHDFSESNVASAFSKGDLTLTITEGKPAKKKLTRKRKTKAVVEEPKEVVVEEPTPAEATFTAEELAADAGNTPFAETSPSIETTIADVKAAAGVTETTAFSTETAGIEESDTGIAAANPFDFNNLGE
jgi:hypothetical protein